MEQGDCAALGSFISEKLMETISYFDYDERFYHGFLTGMLTGMGGYDVLSNRESGEGRAGHHTEGTKVLRQGLPD